MLSVVSLKLIHDYFKSYNYNVNLAYIEHFTNKDGESLNHYLNYLIRCGKLVQVEMFYDNVFTVTYFSIDKSFRGKLLW